MELINNVANSSVEYDYTGGVLTATLTADSGYIIVSAYIQYRHEDGYFTQADFVVDSEGKTATLTAQGINDDSYIEGVTEASAGGVEIINNIAGTTAVGLGDEDAYTITVASDTPIKKQYINTDVIYTDLDGIEVHSEITNIGYPWGRGEVTINNVDLSKPITINGIFDYAVMIGHALTNCTTNIPVGYIAQGVTIDVIVTANEGTEFVTAPQIYYYDNNGYSHGVPLEVNGNTATVSLTLGDFHDFVIWGDCEVIDVIGKDYGAINVYKVTNEQISEFANKRFIEVVNYDPETGAPIVNKIDLGSYVDRIKRLYVPIADGASDVIRCGEHNTNIACVQPAEDRVLLDFGTVIIPYYNGDAVDYEANIKMFLPFIGFTDIDVSYTGRELRLIYDVNVVTGFAVGKLYCDDMLIQVFDLEPSTNVIYRVVSDSISTIGNNTFDEKKQYGLEPFVIIERYESVTPERNNDSEVGKIGDFIGYSRFIDVGLITDPKMLMSEQDLIYDVLQQGVYIE
jgi:hypothetical protein